MAAKRSELRMMKLKSRFYAGMAENGITGAAADQLFDALAAFANFGFPESHSVSFAHLVYCSAWIKVHYPAAFLVSLLNAQPMGFWSPQSLVADAAASRGHGAAPDVNAPGRGRHPRGRRRTSPRGASGARGRCALSAPTGRAHRRRRALGGQHRPGAPRRSPTAPPRVARRRRGARRLWRESTRAHLVGRGRGAGTARSAARAW